MRPEDRAAHHPDALGIKAEATDLVAADIDLEPAPDLRHRLEAKRPRLAAEEFPNGMNSTTVRSGRLKTSYGVGKRNRVQRPTVFGTDWPCTAAELAKVCSSICE